MYIREGKKSFYDPFPISGKGKKYFNIAIIKPDTCFCDHLIRAQVDVSKDNRCVLPSI